VTEGGDDSMIYRKESYKAAKRAGKQQLKQERLAAAETELEGALAERLALVEERLARVESRLAGVAGNGEGPDAPGGKTSRKQRNRARGDDGPRES
jgi:hypothetical protein